MKLGLKSLSHRQAPCRIMSERRNFSGSALATVKGEPRFNASHPDCVGSSPCGIGGRGLTLTIDVNPRMELKRSIGWTITLLRNVYSPENMRAAGFTYEGVGRSPARG